MNIDFPFHFDSRGRTAETDDADHIRDMIEQLLFTNAGERVNRGRGSPEDGRGRERRGGRVSGPGPALFRISVSDGPHCLAQLVEAAGPFGVIEVTLSRPTLEHVFLHHTGHAFGAEEPARNPSGAEGGAA